MNVLWLTNIKIPKIDELEGNKNVTVSGGWLTGLAESMLGSPKIETLTVLFPVYDGKKHVGNNNKFFFEGINVEQRAFNKFTNKHAGIPFWYPAMNKVSFIAALLNLLLLSFIFRYFRIDPVEQKSRQIPALFFICTEYSSFQILLQIDKK